MSSSLKRSAGWKSFSRRTSRRRKTTPGDWVIAVLWRALRQWARQMSGSGFSEQTGPSPGDDSAHQFYEVLDGHGRQSLCRAKADRDGAVVHLLGPDDRNIRGTALLSV